jgi:6-phosphofructo-2-kinase/fructose-2,6-biphosphatase 2
MAGINGGGIHLPGTPASTLSASTSTNGFSRFEGGNTTTTTTTIDNPLPHVLPEGENATPLEVLGSTASDKLVIIMVGLPATGKTHIAKRICRFLSFFHDIPAQIFNVGDYRRQLCGAQMPADFYDPDNVEGMAARKIACDAALADLIEYIQQDGVRVAAFDATNSTFERRQHVLALLKEKGVRAKKMFLESICDQDEVSFDVTRTVYICYIMLCYIGILVLHDFFCFHCLTHTHTHTHTRFHVQLLEQNIRSVKLSTPDYRDMDPEQAVRDFHERRANYMRVYEPVTDRDGSHVKIMNSKQFIVSGIRGYLPLKVRTYTRDVIIMK